MEKTLTFFSDCHKKFFFEQLSKNDISLQDIERLSLFYALGISETLCTHIDQIYDSKYQQINIDALDERFQTSGSKAINELGFNLYNDFTNDSSSLLKIFSRVDKVMIPYLYQAISIRLGLIKITSSVLNDLKK